MSERAAPAWSIVKKIVGAPLLVKAGAGCGIAGGLAIGAMVSAPVVGLGFGVVFGAIAGIAAGVVMDRDDRRGAARMRHLDEVIGVTSGSLGAPPSAAIDAGWDAEDREAELRSWVTEWMTPPPPRVA